MSSYGVARPRAWAFKQERRGGTFEKQEQEGLSSGSFEKAERDGNESTGFENPLSG